MDTGRQRVIQRIADLVRQLPDSVLQSFAGILDSTNSLGDQLIIDRLMNEVTQPQVRQSLIELLELSVLCERALTSSELSFALRSAVAVVQNNNLNENLELVWTGPDETQKKVRRTDQALLDLISGAKSELLIVSFAAYRIGPIVRALQEALERGVVITIVLESGKKDEGILEFEATRAFGEKLLDQCHVYNWPIAKRPTDSGGRHGSLHAKCAVADNATALISSANLTEFAMLLNIELGVMIKGGDVPFRISQHFRGLVDNGVLVRIGQLD